AAELMTRAAELLCAACDLDRAVLSQVDGSTCVPGRLHVVEGPAAAPTELRLVLRGGLLEAEGVRRRQALLVRDARGAERTDAAFVEWFDADAYVAAPLVLADQVVGLFHAARTSGRLTSMDRD